jgi:Glycosyl transferase family 2
VFPTSDGGRPPRADARSGDDSAAGAALGSLHDITKCWVAGEALQRLSVVIPTWNEEAWLPYLLDVLKSYDEVAEIVVADNDSSGRTVDIASAAGCLIARGGRPGPARNNGAAAVQQRRDSVPRRRIASGSHYRRSKRRGACEPRSAICRHSN